MPHRKFEESGSVLTPSPEQTLRERAEIYSDDKGGLPVNIDNLSAEKIQQMLHELNVQQIELEMQNEELRQAHAELHLSQTRYFDLYDLAPVGYFTISKSGMILQANFTAATLLGVVKGSLLKKPLSQFIIKADQDIYYLFRKQLLQSSEAQSCELRMAKPDGESFWAHLITCHALDMDGVAELRVALSDVTAHKQVEEARALLDQVLQDKNTELENARFVAEKANLAKSDFLSSMSHELRTPLSAILGFAQLIESGSPQLTPIQQRSVGQILQAGWFLLELINEILDLALVESGKLSLSLESVPLEEVVHECETMVESQASKGGIHVTFMPVGKLYVTADRTRIKQVLINLLSNAIKYNRAGGTVVVSCDEEKAGRIRINVRDTGEGLSEEKIAQLFQPFNRLGQESHSVEGTGIGLVMTKRLIELMGGEIGLESIVGTGSVFWVEMDLTTQTLPASDLPDQADSLSPSIETDPSLNTLLYVEDNPANLMLIEDIIARRPDTHLLIARDGIQGVAMARATLPTVILMDINLPGISGVEALKILQADPRTAHIPIIALSANAMPRDIEKGMAAGFYRYLTKPIVVNAFLETLGQALEYAKNRAPIASTEDKT